MEVPPLFDEDEPELGLLPAPADVGGGLSWEAGVVPEPYPPFLTLDLPPDEFPLAIVLSPLSITKL